MVTFAGVELPEVQQSAAGVSPANPKTFVSLQGDAAPAWPQQSLSASANEHANAGKAAPRRLTQIITTAVSRRNTGNNSNFPAGWTARVALNSTIPHDKSIVRFSTVSRL